MAHASLYNSPRTHLSAEASPQSLTTRFVAALTHRRQFLTNASLRLLITSLHQRNFSRMHRSLPHFFFAVLFIWLKGPKLIEIRFLKQLDIIQRLTKRTRLKKYQNKKHGTLNKLFRSYILKSLFLTVISSRIVVTNECPNSDFSPL